MDGGSETDERRAEGGEQTQTYRRPSLSLPPLGLFILDDERPFYRLNLSWCRLRRGEHASEGARRAPAEHAPFSKPPLNAPGSPESNQPQNPTLAVVRCVVKAVH